MTAEPQIRYNRLAGYKYRLAAGVRIPVPEFPRTLEIHHKYFRLMRGTLSIKEGYCWDGASGPTIDTPSAVAASLPHDVLYQAIRAGLIPPTFRDNADRVLYRVARERGMPWWRALYFFVAVRIAGGKCVRPRPSEPSETILVA
ncbi:hypothetical protein OpiT1DRAFT_00209 [Opitutaceae bacterium TAV1]|nr:hypothetical protein OpiT1DRAFT_00209 [Opitutaceae bacterium TAV1]